MRERALGVLIAAGAVAAITVTAYRLRDTYVGDAAVYLPYARNAADGHFFQFNLAEFSSGSTSPLWTLLLAIPFVLGLGLGGAKVFAALAAVAGFGALAWAGRTLIAVAAALLALGTMVPNAVSLYESGLVVGTASLALIAGRRWERGGSVTLLAVAWAALMLARPDCAILVGAHAVALAVTTRRLKPLLGALAVAAIPAALYYGYSFAELGTYSTSSQGRSQALREGVDKWVGPLYLDTFALRELFSTPWIFAVLPALAGLVLAARERANRWLAIYGALAISAYVVLLTFVTPGLFDAGRYLVPLIPAVALLAARAFAAVRLQPVVVAAGAAALIGIPALIELRDYQTFLLESAIDEQEVFSRDVVDVINREADAGDEVLSYEVQLRYFLRPDVDVLSQDGITDGKVAPYQADRDMTAFVRRYRPQWWIADNNVHTRGFMRGSVLERASDALATAAVGDARTLDGIRFELVARRERPLGPRFGGWLMLLRLSY